MAHGIFTTERIKAENAMHVGKEIFAHTEVIYYLNKKGKPEPASSAIGLKYGGDYFIITAAHTLRRFEKQILGIIPDSHWIELFGEHVSTDSDTIDNDKFDIGIYKLEKDIIKKIDGSMRFFDVKNLQPDHEDEEGETYMIVGHPLSKVKLRHSEGVKGLSPFIFLSDLNQQDNMFLNQGFKKLTHQLFNYRPRRIYEYVNQKMVQGPSPKGLSGCAIWKVSNLIVDDPISIQYYPTGVVIEYIRDYSVLVVTRMNVVLELLRLSFNLHLSKPNSLLIRAHTRSSKTE